MLFGDDAVIIYVSNSSNSSSRLIAMLLVVGCNLGGMAFEACENSMSVFYCSC
jgi:hypothetical protein